VSQIRRRVAGGRRSTAQRSTAGKIAAAGHVERHMPKMTDDEVWAFLSSEPARPAILATTRPDGRPHAAPVWYIIDGTTIVFNTGTETIKGRNLAHDPRVTLVVDDDRPPFSFVTIEGLATLSEDLGEVRRWAAAIGGRYMGPDKAEALGERNGVPGELLVRVEPRNIVAAKDLAD
jgi:PPOX class probable F420-dependent enzyme